MAVNKLLAVLAAIVLAAHGATAGRELKQALTDADILNFALNLECLEAEFYSWAAFGYGLNDTLRGDGPLSMGGMKAMLSESAQEYASEIAVDEINHVSFLRSALGSDAVPCPLMDIGTAFATAANAAVNATLSPPFSPYGSDAVFYHGAFIFEDVGVTAYKGAAPLISNKDYLTAAAGILAVEAYHAGIIRTELTQIADQTVYPYGVNVTTIIQAISNLRNAVGGAGLDQGIMTTTAYNNTLSNLVPTDNNSIAFSRTPMEVLAIVYLGNSSTPGGFFPNGTNGAIH